MSCVNEKCNKDIPEYGGVLVTCDGDFACSQSCKIEWEKQRDRFFNHTIHDPELTEQWLTGN